MDRMKTGMENSAERINLHEMHAADGAITRLGICLIPLVSHGAYISSVRFGGFCDVQLLESSTVVVFVVRSS
jgi:hypothetical protein